MKQDQWTDYLFSTDGRVCRSEFLAFSAASGFFLFIFASAVSGGCSSIVNLVAGAFALPAALALACIAIRRFHDINLPGTLVFALFVPMLQVIPVIMLVFQGGSAGDNKYGAPGRNGFRDVFGPDGKLTDLYYTMGGLFISLVILGQLFPGERGGASELSARAVPSSYKVDITNTNQVPWTNVQVVVNDTHDVPVIASWAPMETKTFWWRADLHLDYEETGGLIRIDLSCSEFPKKSYGATKYDIERATRKALSSR